MSAKGFDFWLLLNSLLVGITEALIWSFIFCFVIMTIWAMLMVEIVYPLIQDRSNGHMYSWGVERLQGFGHDKMQMMQRDKISRACRKLDETWEYEICIYRIGAESVPHGQALRLQGGLRKPFVIGADLWYCQVVRL